jgi:hypothetical protein
MSISTLGRIAIAGVGALLLSVQPASSFGPTEVYQATEAIDYVVGSTRAIGYFQIVAGQCQLTLTIAEVVDLDRAAPRSAAQLRFAMQPGQVVVVGSEEGAEMLLTCGAKGAILQVTRAEPRP